MRSLPSSKLVFAALAVVGSAACISTVPGPEAPAGQTATQSATQAASAGDDEDAPLTFCAQGHSESLLIEDMEDNDNRTLTQDGRGGYWFSFKDDRGTTINPDSDSQTTWCKPPPSKLFPMQSGGANGSKYAAHMSGKLAKNDGGQWAGIGFALSDGKASCKFDASKYKGITFWAKGPAKVRLRAPDVNNAPEGGVCKTCYNDFGIDLDFGPEWKEYSIPFESLQQQRGRGEDQPHIALNAIYGVMFMVYEGGASFDVSIDDVKLLGCP